MSITKQEGKGGKVTYTANFYYTDGQGERHRKKKEGFAKLRDAKDFEKDFLTRASGNCNMPFSMLYEEYLKDCNLHLKRGSYNTRLSLFNKSLKPTFGDMPVSKITPAKIRDWQNGLIKAGYKSSSQRNYNSLLSIFFNYCVRFYNLRNNPVRVCGFSSSSNRMVNNEKLHYWTIEQFNKFIGYVTDATMKLIFYILFFSGLRIGELLALCVEDFNPDAGTITVSKTMTHYDGKKILGTPKTPTSNRTIKLPDKVCKMLSDYIGKMYKPSPKELYLTTGVIISSPILKEQP
jgi:integrase